MTNPSAKSLPARKSARARGAFAFLAGLTILGWCERASAQGWLADRRYTEGPGIKAGDLELHPGIGGEVGYDSNWFLRSSETGANIINGAPTNPPADAAVVRISPSFYVSTLGQQRLNPDGVQRLSPRFVTFRGGVSATGRFFIGKGFSDQHNVSLNADGRLDLNQGNPISFGVFGGYSRIIQPQVFSDPNLAFNRDDVALGADVTFLPGGGTLDLRAGYTLRASLYEETAGAPYSSLIHEISVKDRWKFRPRTALFSEASLSFLDYPNAPRASLYLNDATPLRTRAGLTGLVSDWLGTTIAGGYSATFFKNPTVASSTQYDSFNAQVEGTIYFGGNGSKGQDLPGEATLLLSTFNLGFQRDFQRSLLGNFYGANRLYAKLEYWFAGRVVLDVHAAGEQLNYPPVFYTAAAAAQTADFTNYRVLGGIFAEYRFSQSFGINTTIDYVRQFSGTQLPAGAIPGTGTPGVFDMNYQRLQAFLGVRYFY